MHRVTLGQTGLHSSALGFGCASIGGKVAARRGRAALDEAFERGVTFFDTARSYGYGDSERILGRFLRGRRERVVLATKCGISAGDSNALKRMLKGMVRPVLTAVPGLARSLRTALGRQHQAN